MGEEFLGGVCSGKRWNPPQNMFSGGDSGGWSSLCSVAQLGSGCEVSCFGWPSEAVKEKHGNIIHNNNNNNNSLAFDDNSIIFPVDMDSTFDAIFPSDCQQINLLGKDGGNDGNFGSIIEDDINQGLFMCTNNFSTTNINNSCNQDRSPPMALTTSSNNSSSGDSSTITGEGCGGGGLTAAFDPINSSASYLIQTLFDDTDDNSPFTKTNYINNNNNELVSPCNNSWVTNDNNNCAYPPINMQLHQNNVNQQLVDGTMNVMINASTDHVNSNIQASLLNSYNLHSRSSRASNHCPKVNSAQVRDTKVQVRQSKSSVSDEQPPVNKRARIETPSPLPTFKVRKEKLGDRITALQQLVSPFGKTDTASVLHEAIEYIKFLHDQVSALCTPYLKNGAPIQQQQGQEKSNEDTNEDLRSRGLCLVPISSTYPMAQETPVDFWTPTFG